MRVHFCFLLLFTIATTHGANPPKRPTHTFRAWYEKQIETVPASPTVNAKGDFTLLSNDELEVRGSGELGYLRSNTGNVLPQSLYETGARITLKKEPYLFLVGMSSNSDVPFHSYDEYDFLAFAGMDVYKEDYSRVFVTLQYNTKRTFLRDIPLVFVGYEYRKDDIFLLLSVPIIFRMNLSEDWSLRATYFPVINTDLEIVYRPKWYFETALIYRWLNTKYLLAGRSNKEEFTFYEYQQVGVKVRWTAPYLFMGYRYRSLAYQGESFGDDKNLTHYDSSFVIQAGLEMAVF